MASKKDKMTPAELRAEIDRLEQEVKTLDDMLKTPPGAERIYVLQFFEIARLRAVLSDIANGTTFSDGKRGRTPKSRAKAALEK
jgi:uncharacterized small protein (DUF1192 family)